MILEPLIKLPTCLLLCFFARIRTKCKETVSKASDYNGLTTLSYRLILRRFHRWESRASGRGMWCALCLFRSREMTTIDPRRIGLQHNTNTPTVWRSSSQATTTNCSRLSSACSNNAALSNFLKQFSTNSTAYSLQAMQITTVCTLQLRPVDENFKKARHAVPYWQCSTIQHVTNTNKTINKASPTGNTIWPCCRQLTIDRWAKMNKNSSVVFSTN